MVSSITLGNFSNIGGQNVLSGLANSGLDENALISGLVQAKQAPATLLQQQITDDDKVVSALGQFQQLLSAFQSAANDLRNPPGVGNAADNGFAYNSVSLSSNTSVSADNYVSVTASPGAALQNFDITYIQSLAAATKQTSNTFSVATADTTGVVVASGAVAGQLNAGSVTINGAAITFDPNDTLNSIAAKFNNVTNQTKISASVVKLADNSFVLSFNGVTTGAADAFDLGSAGTVTSDPSGVLSQITFATNQTASDAKFELDGQTVTRPTNSINDAIPDVTIQLQKIMAGEDPNNPPPTPTTITATVQADTQTAHDSVVAFFNAYNDLKQFAATQTKLQADGTYDPSAVLATNSVFRTTMDTIVSEVSSTVLGLANGNPKTLGDIGITFTTSPATSTTPEVSNVITIDDTQFKSFLASNYNGVRQLFEFTFNTDSTNLSVFSRTNALSTNAFTFDANPFASQVTDPISVADADTAIAFDSPTDGQLGTGPVTINGQTVTITNNMTLNQVAAAFNAVEASSGLHAAVTQVDTGKFTLTFTATRQNGQPNLFNLATTSQDPSGVFGHVHITATGTFQATYDPGTGPVTVDMDASSIVGSGGYLLTGKAGTALEGLQLVYGSQAAEESHVTLSQGIADQLYNTSNGVLDPNSGSLKTNLDSINTEEDDLNTRIGQINDQVAQYTQQLLAQFSALEQALEKVNELLLSLTANDLARQQAASL
jgi:flagellar hook-associated protein 2